MELDQTGSQFSPANDSNSAFSVMSANEFYADEDRKFYEQTGVHATSRPNYSFWGNIDDFFTGTRKWQEEAYQGYLLKNQREYEQKQINDARAFQEYLDSTKYQRMVKDLKAAGLNPWLAVQNGIGNSSVNSGSSSYSTSARKFDSGKSSSGSDLLSTLLNGAFRIAMLALLKK